MVQLADMFSSNIWKGNKPGCALRDMEIFGVQIMMESEAYQFVSFLNKQT